MKEAKEPICPIYQTTPEFGDVVWWMEKGTRDPAPAIVSGCEGPGELTLHVLKPNQAQPFVVMLRVRHKSDPRHTTGQTHVDKEHAFKNGTWDYRPSDLPLKANVYKQFERYLEKRIEQEDRRRAEQKSHEDLQAKRQAVQAVNHKPEMLSVG